MRRGSLGDVQQLTYGWMLWAHSWLRWILLGLGALAWISSAAELLIGERASAFAEKAGRTFVMVLDTQVALGLGLYLFFSPLIQSFQRLSPEIASSHPEVSFWRLRHPLSMIGALILIHAGRVYSRRCIAARARGAAMSISLFLGSALILSAIPWDRVRL